MLRRFSIFLKTSMLDSRVLIICFFKYRYFDFGNSMVDNRIFPRVMCSVFRESRVGFFAIYTDSSSVLSTNTLTNLRTRSQDEQATFYIKEE